MDTVLSNLENSVGSNQINGQQEYNLMINENEISPET